MACAEEMEGGAVSRLAWRVRRVSLRMHSVLVGEEIADSLRVCTLSSQKRVIFSWKVLEGVGDMK